MGAAGVVLSEIDLSTRVPSFPGVYAGIVIPAKKGEVNVARLVTSETDFLLNYTPNEKVEIGYDLSHYSALTYLAKANKLWVVRSANASLYGGVELRVTAAPSGNTAITAGISDPTAYSFDATASDEGCVLLHGKNQGAWNNDIHVKIIVDPAIVKETDAFIIEVYKTDNLVTPVESFVASRKVGKKDGFGKNIYVEDVLNSSSYIGAVDNLLIADTVLPLVQSTTLQMANGSDGSAVTDSEMITGLAELANKNSVPLTLILDGGWATTAYQSQIISTCEARQDCYGVLSTPFSAESTSTYMTDILTYRNTTLAANTSYAGINTPHMKIYDKFNDRNDLPIPPDGFAAAAISDSASNFEIWFPAAGSKRGAINGASPYRVFSDGELDLLYDGGVNPMKFAPNKGTRRWGQKTLSTRPSALDRENVRLLLLVIEPAITEALDDFVFEINDDSTRAIATAIIESFLENIQARRGIFDFLVTIDDTNNTQADIDNNIMNAWVFVKPALSAEFIKFKTIITKTGVDFSIAAEQV